MWKFHKAPLLQPLKWATIRVATPQHLAQGSMARKLNTEEDTSLKWGFHSMNTLFRVFRNIILRFYGPIAWLLLALATIKFGVINPWGAELQKLRDELYKLQQVVSQKDQDFEKNNHQNIQQQIDTAIERERLNVQRLIESAASTAVAQHMASIPQHVQHQEESTTPQVVQSTDTTVSLEKAWATIQKRFENGQSWYDLLPANTPEENKVNVTAQTKDQLVRLIKEAETMIDDTPSDQSSWVSSIIRIRRLNDMPQTFASILELAEKENWQAIVTQLESHPHSRNSKIQNIVAKLRDRLRYEAVWSQLTHWKQTLCATSVQS